MNTIKQIIPLSDSMTPLLRCMGRHKDNDDWFDALFNGWYVGLARYEDKDGTELEGFITGRPDDYLDIEEGLIIVPTMYCNMCHNRMEAFTGEIPSGESPEKHLKYRCRYCGIDRKLSEVE